MGYNTTVLLLNDSLDVLAKHPDEFFRGLIEKMDRGGGDISVQGHANPAYVMPTAHADIFRLYCTWQNGIIELSPYNAETMQMGTSDKEYLRKYLESVMQQAQWTLDSLRERLET